MKKHTEKVPVPVPGMCTVDLHDRRGTVLPLQKLFLQQNPSQNRLPRLSQKPLLPKQKRLHPKKPLKLQKRLIRHPDRSGRP